MKSPRKSRMLINSRRSYAQPEGRVVPCSRRGPKYYRQASLELQRRFQIELLNFEAKFLQALQESGP